MDNSNKEMKRITGYIKVPLKNGITYNMAMINWEHPPTKEHKRFVKEEERKLRMFYDLYTNVSRN